MDPKQAQKIQAQGQEYQKEFDRIGQEIQELIPSLQQVMTALAETEMVKQEMDLLDTDAVVYKQYGPVLIKKDVDEAQMNVNQRLNLLKKQHESLEEKRTKLRERQDELHRLMLQLKEQFRKAQQAAIAKATNNQGSQK